jgi:hypothetical protein
LEEQRVHSEKVVTGGYQVKTKTVVKMLMYEQLGLIERRFAGGTEFNRRKGYEWRFK